MPFHRLSEGCPYPLAPVDSYYPLSKLVTFRSLMSNPFGMSRNAPFGRALRDIPKVGCEGHYRMSPILQDKQQRQSCNKEFIVSNE